MYFNQACAALSLWYKSQAYYNAAALLQSNRSEQIAGFDVLIRTNNLFNEFLLGQLPPQNDGRDKTG